MSISLPVFFENSRVPAWLSRVVPIDVYAFSFGVGVWCRGVMSDRTKRHEIIHYKQQLELLFVFQWLLYVLFHVIGLIRYRDGQKAYYENPFEREAYENDADKEYLQKRKRFAWVGHL